MKSRVVVLACLLFALGSTAVGQTVLVEAESFAEKGGWVVDQQFMDQMGSPYLLAHGLGEPVSDAVTTVSLPATGTYRVFVRTKDWVAHWKAHPPPFDALRTAALSLSKVPPPGKFQVLIDGKALPETFGTKGREWFWHDGGKVSINKRRVKLALHDLTGLEGRCDAVLFTKDLNSVPPNEPKAMAAFRRKALGLPKTPPDAGRFDLVVVGGGVAGTCAAVSAARLGLRVALIQDRPVLGGNNSSEVRVHRGGRIRLPPFPAVGGVVAELGRGGGGNAGPPERYGDDRKEAVVRAEKNIDLHLNMHAFAVDLHRAEGGRRIRAVVARHVLTGRELRFPAWVFADCTGDGTVGFLAGADFRYGREGKDETGEPLAPAEGDKMTMGTSNMWYARPTDGRPSFPDCPWALDNRHSAKGGDWNWESGFFLDTVADAEIIRDYNFRAVYGTWAYTKKTEPKYAGWKLAWIAYIGGKRESRRLLGDVILREQDIRRRKEYPDACVTTTWSIDLHYPTNAKQFPDGGFRSRAAHSRIAPYAIPYRCFYSRNVDNLLMAGRCISVTHVALGTVRVMGTTGMMGEVVGMAASICRKRNTTPRGVYQHHLTELKALCARGVGKAPPPVAAVRITPPAWLKNAPPSLAGRAEVSVSGSLSESRYPRSMLTDGRIDVGDNGLRWVSERKLPNYVEFTWKAPQTIDAARIVSGYMSGETVGDPIVDFVLQHHDGKKWRDIPGAGAVGNTRIDWHATFAEVKTRRVRLLVTASPGDCSRIWEIGLYCVRARRE